MKNRKILTNKIVSLFFAFIFLAPSLALPAPMQRTGGGISNLLMDAEKTRYVTKNGSNANDGKSWDKAKLTVRSAVESLPEEGEVSWNFRKAGDIYIGEGLFVENGTGLPAGEPIIEATSNIRFHGSGVPVSNSNSGGTVIKVADGSNRHLFGPRLGFTDWSHSVILENMGIEGNKANNVGPYDLYRSRLGGFNSGLYNVVFKNASRYAINIIDNAVNFYAYNIAGSGCETAFFRMNLASSANTTNIGFFGVQVDDCGDYVFDIDSSANGNGNFFIHGLETEALTNADTHKAVIRYTPRAGANGLNISLNDIFGYKGDNPPKVGQAVIEVASGSGADPIIIWQQVVNSGYDNVFKHVDGGVTSSAREFCYMRGSTARFCLDGTRVLMEGLPTSDPSNPGQIWNSSGDLRISQ